MRVLRSRLGNLVVNWVVCSCGGLVGPMGVEHGGVFKPRLSR